MVSSSYLNSSCPSVDSRDEGERRLSDGRGGMRRVERLRLSMGSLPVSSFLASWTDTGMLFPPSATAHPSAAGQQPVDRELHWPSPMHIDGWGYAYSHPPCQPSPAPLQDDPPRALGGLGVER